MRTLVIPSAFALLFVAGAAFAADMPMTMDGHPMNPGGPMHYASTTMHGPADWHGSTTPGMWHATSTRPMMGGFNGMVLTVGSNSFTMAAPRLDNKRMGTTTLTVNVTASTTYNIASSTAAFSSIAVGEHVVVFGKVSTSTQSIAAEHVMILNAPPKAKGVRGILERILNIFGMHLPMGAHASTTTAAAAVSGSGLGALLHSLFGWL